MVSPPAHFRRHFLSWDRPLLPQAVAWLAGDWRGDGPLDLSRVLVVVPTRQSGRRLREALAVYAATKKQAVFPPRVLPPETLLSLHVAPNVASRLDALLAWVEVCATLELASFREVFPLDPPARNFAWAFQLAQTFGRLQATLAETGRRFRDVTAAMGNDFPERERWGQLGELERRHEEILAAHGLHDPQAARIDAARTPAPFPEVDRIVLLAVPDPLPLALHYLGAQSAQLPIDVVVFAPSAEGTSFDVWGRPIPEAWAKRELALPDFNARVHLCADPAAQAEQIAALARAYSQPDGALAVGIADAEVLPLLVSALARAEVPTFNPEGRSRRQEALFHLLAALAALVREPTFGAVAALARCPDFLALLAERGGAEFSVVDWLAELDRLRERHLPADLAAARRHAAAGTAVAAGLALVDELCEKLTHGDFAAGAAAALGALFAARRLALENDFDQRLAEAARTWTEVVRECAEAGGRFDRLTTAEWWEVALRLYGDGFATEEKTAGALELQGWLELLWEDAPHLVGAGLNDGCVPDAVLGDAFLPESLRVQLGLKTNEARFARDAYLLQAVTACRPRTDWFLGKTSAAGDPLRPSRLLLRCSDAELPARIAFLFRTPPLDQPNFPWERAWRLHPRVVAPPVNLRVTALRDFLQCPFRFYLRHVLKMETVDPEKNELDALDFGTLCHAALEQLGRQPSLRDCTDPTELREAMWQAFDRAVRARFGPQLTLPLLVQCESARQRLAKVAEVQARERAAGWRIEAVEETIDLKLGDRVVKGKIDRIERHVESGALRVLDYKTSDAAVDPAAVHLARLRPGETPPEWALLELEGQPRKWADLQLPLYWEAVRTGFAAESLSVGYFNLPKAVGETGIVLWEDYAPDTQAAARRCAEAACAAIGAGQFWPPNETVEPDYDAFAALFHHGVAASVGWEEKT